MVMFFDAVRFGLLRFSCRYLLLPFYCYRFLGAHCWSSNLGLGCRWALCQESHQAFVADTSSALGTGFSFSNSLKYSFTVLET